MIPQQYIQWFYSIGLTGVVAGMTLSKPAVSIGIFFCGLGWLLQGSFIHRFKQLVSNRFFQVSVLLIVLHLAGLLWSTDLQYGLKDIKTKLPLVLLPVFLLGDRVFGVKKHFGFIQFVFLGALVACTFLSFAIYFHWIKPQQFSPTDMRTMIFSVSGVRLALFICLGICLLIYLCWKNKNTLYRLGFIILTGWFLFFLNFIESGTGMMFLFVLAVFTPFFLVYKYFPGWKRWAIMTPCLLLIAYGTWSIYGVVTDMLTLKPDTVTATHSRDGEAYITVEHLAYVENGYIVGKHTAPKELEQAWNERSSINYYGRDKKGQNMYATVIRYLNSMGKAKDREALETLTDQDIRNIENGIANQLYTRLGGWKKRLLQIIFEFEAYQLDNNPFGNSITQRFEYWKIATALFKRHLWTGVGTGDVRNAFETVYNQYPYEVENKFRLRAHNQYLTMGVSFGVAGLLIFVIYALSLLWTGNYREHPYLSLCFLLIMLLSFVSEDTLETQSGVTFVAFFHTFFHLRSKSPQEHANL